MKENLKLFINYLVNKFVLIEHSVGAHELSITISYLIALSDLKRISYIQNGTEYDLLEDRFPDLFEIYTKTFEKLPSTLRTSLPLRIDELVNNSGDEAEKLIAWIFQFLKRPDEKAAFNKVGKNNTKIEGRELLLTTQFFTDDYMVRFLTDECLNGIDEENILNTVVIDCASGGGNFLLYSYEVLFAKYRSILSDWDDQRITDTILNEALIGYDLDAQLSRMASLSLFIKACKRAIPSKFTSINIFGGQLNDKLGFLSNKISSNKINDQSFDTLLKRLKRDGKVKIWLTNPPFMGKRDMDTGLKDFLIYSFPEAKSDLCVSFMQRILALMDQNDKAGLVAQSNWMHLSSLKSFRKLFLAKNHLQTCVDLGSNAFANINGEKTSVVLLVIGASLKPLTRFIELRQTTMAEKHRILSSQKYPNQTQFEIDTKQFLGNESFEFDYQFQNRFQILRKMETYGQHSNPMQGTSTGDNLNFVKFAWEVNGSPDWKLVSKGGGFSKWTGLNYYKVYWGENAEKIKANKGSALRNINKINSTQLVYSDTGTLGLNVRVLKPGQVFIASGPGIQVLNGDKYAHMAFLNSRVATFLLKRINPKFTISAGYIAKIPVASGILDSHEIAHRSLECLEMKESYLKNKLPNLEFRHEDYEAIDNLDIFIKRQLNADLYSDYKRLSLESEIETEIFNKFKFNRMEREEIYKVVGKNPLLERSLASIPSISMIDQMIAASIDINCVSTSRAIRGHSMGSESVLEDLSFKLSAHPATILQIAVENSQLLKLTKAKYVDDLLHKVILYELGIDQIGVYKHLKIHKSELVNILKSKYQIFSDFDGVLSKVDYLLNTHHKSSFFNKPLINVSKEIISVGQNV